MTSLVALNSDAHRNLKVEVKDQVALAEGHNLLPIFMAEFGPCSSECPVVFAKNNETGQIRPVIMTGFTPDENLLCENGKWLGRYLPGSLRPSALVAMPDKNNSEKLVICVDEDSKLVNTDLGERLFDDEGNQTEFLQHQSKLAAEVRAHGMQMLDFIDTLTELSLLKSNPISITPPSGQPFNVTGLYFVDEVALGELPAEKLAELRDKGYLRAIYASLVSLHRLDDLMQRRAKRSAQEAK
ncbi:hypothetical protein GCM10008090_02970 [Arenicella chitinivorans]|uniref:SapC protein n=1 Tax=Arenicella chitinivorans TaxID=1329800 RepID=A0A918VI45_9GAMM|nr:SapC family protein [Arenicella chitinivorans]GGZ98035.1 hypothetical protein GCM10008090_02970 [Arenicella chitinivorans]